MSKWMVAFFGLMLLAGAFAQNVTKPNTLGLKYGIMECRVNAVISLVEYSEESANTSSLKLADNLKEDLDALKAYADNGDREGFNTYMHGRMKSDLQSAVIYLKDVKRNLLSSGPSYGRKLIGGGPSEEKDKWNAMHLQVMQNRAACIQSVALGFARGQESDFEMRLREMNQTKNKLKNKSVGVAKMESILEEGYANLNELRDAISRGNGSNMYEIMQKLREQHLHIWARFHIAKVKAILDTIDAQADAAGYSSEADAIRALIESVEPLVEPGRPYEPGDFDTVKGTLVQAHNRLRELIRKLNQGGSA